MWNLLLNNKVRHLLALCMIWAGLAAQAQPTSWVRTFVSPGDDRAADITCYNGKFYMAGYTYTGLGYYEIDMQGNVLQNLNITDFEPYSYVPNHIIPYNDSVRIWGYGALATKPMYVTLNKSGSPVSHYMYMLPTGHSIAFSTIYIQDNDNIVFSGAGGIYNDFKVLFQRYRHSTSELLVNKYITGTDLIIEEQGGPFRIFPTVNNGHYLIFTKLNVIEIDSMGNTVRIETLRDRHPRPPTPSYEFKPPQIEDIVQGDSGKYVSIDREGFLNIHDTTGRITSSVVIPRQHDGSFSDVVKLCRTRDGGYAFGGDKFLKLDRNFNVISSANLSFPFLKAFGQAEDGGFYGCFHNWTNEELSNDIIAFKTEPDGRILTSVQEKLRVQRGYYAYPNPVTDVLHLRNMNDVVHITLTNALGQTVYSGLETAIDMHSLPIGMYYLHVTTTAQQYVEPIIKQ
jgi:hypothetical protein